MLTLIYNNETKFLYQWTMRASVDLNDFMGDLDESVFTLVQWDTETPAIPDGYVFDNYVANPDTQTITVNTIVTPTAALEAKLADDSITFEEMKELMRLRG
jgi:hypothetical protein